MSGPDSAEPQDSAVVSVRIETWAAGGRGLARVGGRVWMIDGAVPDDVVRARIRRDHGRWVEGEVVSIAEPSTSRRAPPCAIQAICGGCPMMPVEERLQRAAKRRIVQDALERIGRLEAIDVEACVASPRAVGYRNKLELTLGLDATGRRVLGYHVAGHPGRIVDVPRCPIGDPALDAALGAVRGALLEGEATSDPALANPREPVRAVLRVSASSGEILVALRTAPGPFPSAARLAHGIAGELTRLAGVVRIHAVPGRRGGARVETLWGRPSIEEAVLGTTFRVPAGAFLQVNAEAFALLGAHVIEGCGGAGTALELYGGIGATGIALAAGGTRVTVVEADAEAVACGREAAERAGRPVRFVAGDVLRHLRGERAAPDLVLVDPPRAGLGPGVAGELVRLAAKHLVYVSCDPATLARDLRLLAAGGYAVDRVVPFDLFPQTAHVEAVAWLTRAGGDRRTPPRASPPRASC